MASGWVTPTEAGVLACAYALLVGMLERTITISGIVGSLIETAEASALILFIIAASSALSYVFVAEGTAAQLSQLMASLSVGTVSFLIISNLLAVHPRMLHRDATCDVIAVPYWSRPQRRSASISFTSGSW